MRFIPIVRQSLWKEVFPQGKAEELKRAGNIDTHCREDSFKLDFQRLPERDRDIDLLHIFVDADACPVKKEIFRVAGRNKLRVTLVANSWMRIPHEPWIALEVVGDGFDEADDWIVEHVQRDDVVITADVPLASRCLKEGASVLGPSGKSFTEDNIGDAVATRDLLSDLRDAGEITGGPPPLQKRDRSRFLQQLDDTIQSIRRKQP